jgi:hypothetical protein
VATIRLKVDGESYLVENDPQRYTAAELNAVERHTGMTVREWAEKLMDGRGSSLAWTALAWVAVRRSGKYVRWDDFEENLSFLELLASIEEGPAEVPVSAAEESGEQPGVVAARRKKAEGDEPSAASA